MKKDMLPMKYSQIPMPSKRKKEMTSEEDEMMLEQIPGEESESEEPESGMPDMEMPEEMMEGADLSSASDEDLMAEMKKRGLK